MCTGTHGIQARMLLASPHRTVKMATPMQILLVTERRSKMRRYCRRRDSLMAVVERQYDALAM